MNLRKIAAVFISALCALSAFGTVVYAAEDLPASITAYVTDDGMIPADGTHTFVLSDGSSSVTATNSGNLITFTNLVLPADSPIRVYTLWEEQKNPELYTYDTSVYQITLVANDDHTEVAVIDYTKDNEAYDGILFFANKVAPTPTASTEGQRTQTTVITDQNGNVISTETKVIDSEPATEPEEVQTFEREHAMQGVIHDIDGGVITIYVATGAATQDVYTVDVDNAERATDISVGDTVMIGFNGEESTNLNNAKNVVIGKGIAIEFTTPVASHKPTVETKETTADKKETPVPSATPSAAPVEPVVVKKRTIPVLPLVLAGCGAAIVILLMLLRKSIPNKTEDEYREELARLQQEEKEAEEEDDPYEDLDDEEDDTPVEFLEPDDEK